MALVSKSTVDKSRTSRVSPLARRLVFLSITFSTLVALLTTASQLYFDYRRELNQIDLTFQRVADTHLATIASALWATNKNELQIAVDGLSRIPYVHQVTVTENKILWAESGELTSDNIRTRFYPLMHLHRERLVDIGTLKVIVDLEGVYEKLLEKFWVILISNGVKTFLVSGFMLWLFYWFVTRHLRRIANFASRLEIKNLSEKLRLSRSKTHSADEFDLVLDGFSRMQLNLSSTLQELEYDIAERKITEKKLKLSASVFKHSHQGIIISDANGIILDVNPAFTRIMGYAQEEVVGKNPRMLRSNRYDNNWYDRMWKTLNLKSHWSGEVWNRRKNGDVFPEQEDISAVYSDTGKVVNYVSIFSDISLQKQHESELDRIAHYDILTNLPNRRLLIDRLSQAMPRTQRQNKLLAIAYLDIDGFKRVNDLYGHGIGDRLLVEVSNRLKQTLRGEDTLARLGGDEFILLLGNLAHVDDCIASLNRALAAVNAPILIDDIQMDISASIGVTLYPLDDDTGDTLLRHADQAMYMAKQSGKNCYHLFDSKQDKKQQDYISQLHTFKEALRNQEFIFYYQPKVNMLTGGFLGVEALIRWQHPEQGLLSPAFFLNTITNHPLEVDLGLWVIDTALNQIETWQHEGLCINVSVNISAYHLLHPDFMSQITNLLHQHSSVSASQLELEVLETAAMSDLNQAINVMTQCREMGLKISLDDFGTGYSSLAYFRRFPVNTIKIDKSFVQDMTIDKEGIAVVKSIVQLAELFERSIIAEGVETKEQCDALIELGCCNAQGYYISRPMPANELPNWLVHWLAQSPVGNRTSLKSSQ